MYHRIADPDHDPWELAVSPVRFEEHLQLIRDRFRPLALRDLLQGVWSREIPQESVTVTFDDGYRDNLTAAKPLLDRYDVPATVFVVSASVGSGRSFWWEELKRACFEPERLPERLELDGRAWEPARFKSRWALFDDLWRVLRLVREPERLELLAQITAWADAPPPAEPVTLSVEDLSVLARGGLVEIGAHTKTHPKLSDLPADEQLGEITEGKQHLEELLGRAVETFSYPYGDHSRTTVRCVREAGLACACTTLAGGVTGSTNPYRLPRLHVGDWSGDELAESLSSWLR
jgi:peptidoglycan/xylan/chitin deacetylase (PgdA/CDA1 family)